MIIISYIFMIYLQKLLEGSKLLYIISQVKGPWKPQLKINPYTFSNLFAYILQIAFNLKILQQVIIAVLNFLI